MTKIFEYLRKSSHVVLKVFSNTFNGASNIFLLLQTTVKLCGKDWLDSEQSCYSEPFFVTNLPVYFINCEQPNLALMNNFSMNIKFLITIFDFISQLVMDWQDLLHCTSVVFCFLISTIFNFGKKIKSYLTFLRIFGYCFSDRQMRASILVFEPTKPDLLTLKLGFPFWSELKLFNLQWIPKWF